MEKQVLNNVTDNLPKKTNPFDIDKVVEQAGSIIDVKGDLEDLKCLNPKDVYDSKNEAIKSADLSLEEKIAMYDDNQRMYLENHEKAADILNKIRNNKISAVFDFVICMILAAAFSSGGSQVYQNKIKKYK